MDACDGSTCNKPAAFWTFDKSDGTDSSGNGNTLTITPAGATPYSQGFANFGFQPQATGAWLKGSKNIDFTPAGSPNGFTIEAWVGTSSWPAGDFPIFTEGPAAPTPPAKDTFLSAVVRGGHPYFGFAMDDTASTSAAFSANTWYHLAFVYDGAGTQKIYINGVLDTTTTGHGNFAGPSSAMPEIGAEAINPAALANGSIDQVRVFQYARSDADILEDATLVAHYNFDNPAGSLADDTSNQINLTFTGTAAAAAGRSGMGLSLGAGGVNGYAKAVGFAQLGTSQLPFSVEAWINPTSPVGDLIFYSDAGNCITLLSLNGYAEATIAQAGPTRLTINEGFTIPSGLWTHVAVTFSPANGLRLYVNGNVVAGTNSTFFGSGSPQTVYLGAPPGVGACWGDTGIFNGLMDDVRIYNVERTRAQISADTNSP
jgi:hypothetical protein